MQSSLIAPKGHHPRTASELSSSTCSQAILALCPLDGLKEKLSASPLSEPFISRLDVSCQYAGIAGPNRILLLECTGDSVAVAKVLEELAARGIKSVIGYGYADSLTTLIPEGQLVLAESAVEADPAVRRLIRPDSRLFQNLRDCAARQCICLRRARVLNADLAAPDYRQKIARRRELDAEVARRDVWDFLTAGRQLAVSTAFACVIGGEDEDTVGRGESDPIHQGMSELEAVVSETLRGPDLDGPNYG
jgi:hypothetical protein